MFDLTKNFIPDMVKKIHLIAICGTGMGALACMFKDMGFEVTGSDKSIYPPMSTFIENKGIKIFDGFNEKNISPETDLVVVGNAVRKDNVEVLTTNKMGLNFCSMPQAVNRFIAGGKKALLITGTHGKTTTSSILAWVLYKGKLDPSFIIGGILNNFNSNYRYGRGGYVVIEGDEYDTAFFDKGAKFFHYKPLMTVLTSVEFDHADIFTDINHVNKTFDSLIFRLPEKSSLFACSEDNNVRQIIKEKTNCRIFTYGANAFWSLGSVAIKPPWTKFDVLKSGKYFGTFKTKLMGRHNLLNILSVVAVANDLSIDKEIIGTALETFKGIKRRQEVRGIIDGVTIMDDFAHHPTAVRETVRAVKPYFPEGRVIAVFEPRTNSSMRKIFQNIYPLSFDHADIICIRKPPLLSKIPENDRFSSKKLVDDLKKRGLNAFYFTDTTAIIDYIQKIAKSGDLVLIMSNGGFDNIHGRLLKKDKGTK